MSNRFGLVIAVFTIALVNASMSRTTVAQQPPNAQAVPAMGHFTDIRKGAGITFAGFYRNRSSISEGTQPLNR